MAVLTDDFARTVTDGAGTASNGLVYTVVSGASGIDVDGANLLLSRAPGDGMRVVVAAGAAQQNFDEVWSCSVSPKPSTGGSRYVDAGMIGRYENASNYLVWVWELDLAGNQVRILIFRVTGGVWSAAGGATYVVKQAGYTAGEVWNVRCQAEGTSLRMRAWKGAEPGTWDLDIVEATHNVAGGFGWLLDSLMLSSDPATTVTIPSVTGATLGAGGAAPTVAQTRSGVTSVAATSVSSSALTAVGAGNALLCLVAVNCNSQAAPTITPPAGFTAVGPAEVRQGGSPVSDQNMSQLFVRADAGGVSGALSASWGVARHGSIIVVEVAGVPTSSPIDKWISDQGTGLAMSSGVSASTTAATDLLLGFFASQNAASTHTPGAGFAELVEADTATTGASTLSSSAVSKALSATGTQEATATLSGATSRAWTAWAVALLPGNVAPPPTHPIPDTTAGPVFRGDSLQLASSKGFPDVATAKAYAAKRDILTANPNTYKLGRKAGAYPAPNDSAQLYADDMQLANPDLIFVMYQKSVQNSEWNGIGLPEQWYAHDTSSQVAAADRVSVFSPSIYLMQPQDDELNPDAADSNQPYTDTANRIKTSDKASAATYNGHKEWHPQAVKRDNEDENARYGQGRFTLIKGIFLDSVGEFSLSRQNIPGTLVKYEPSTSLTGSHTFPTGTVTVASTTQFASSGSFNVGGKKITYTGKTATTFTGCTGGTGTVAGGSSVTSTAQKNRWFDRVKEVIDAVFSLCVPEGAIIVCNGESNPSVEAHCHVVMAENWLKANTSGPLDSSSMSASKLESEVDAILQMQLGGAAAWCLSKYWEATRMSEANKRIWDDWLVFAWRLGNYSRAILEMSRDPVDDPYTQTYAASYFSDLGAPLDKKTTCAGYELTPATALKVNSGVFGVYGATFTKGAVLGNASSLDRIVTLDRSDYRDLNTGNLVGSGVLVPAWRAVHLTRPEDPNVPVYVTLPSIPTQIVQGSEYACNPGLATNADRYTYRHQVGPVGEPLPIAEAAWVDIPGATGQSRTAAEPNRAVSCLVKAINDPSGANAERRSNAVMETPLSRSSEITDPAGGSGSATGPIGTTYTLRGRVVGYTALTVNGSSVVILSDGTWSKAVTLAAAGANVYTCVASEPTSGASETDFATVTLTVPDTTPPTLALSAPTEGQVFGGGTTSITVTGTASDAGSGLQRVTVAGVAVPNPASFSVQTPVSIGSNAVAVVATDNAGNQRSMVRNVQVAPLPSDATPPTAAITSPATNPYVVSQTVPFQLAIAGTAADNVAVSSVTVDGVLAAGTTAWSRTVTISAFGTRVIPIVVTDSSGNTFRVDLEVQVTAPDLTPPIVSISVPAGDQTIVGTAPYTQPVSGTVVDEAGGSGVSHVLVNGQLVTPAGAAWSTTLSLSYGSTVVSARGVDVAGNVSAAVTRTITLQAPPPSDVVAPALNFTDPPTPAIVRDDLFPGQLYNVTGTIFDVGSGVATLTVNGAAVQVAGDGTWAYPLILSAGTNPIIAVGTDVAGNATTVTSSIIVSDLTVTGTDVSFDLQEAIKRFRRIGTG